MNSSLKAIYHSALKLMVPLSSEETYATVVNEAQKLADALYGTIFLMQDGHLRRVYTTVPEKLRIEPRKEGYTYQSFMSRKAMVVPISRMKKIHPVYEKNRARKVVFIPLSYEDYSIGVVALDSTNPNRFAPNKLQTLQVFGSLASLKIRNHGLVEDLKDAIQTRDLFISMASHELKTPLTAISAYAQLIKKSILSNKQPKKEWLDSLTNSSMRMTRLINELLHINQIRSGKMNYSFAQVNVTELVQTVISDFKMSYPNQTVKVFDATKDQQILLTGDRDKLIQVFINLLNNAAKFTDDEKTVELSVLAKNKKIFFTVKDQGKGIEKQDLKNLFQEFYKGKNNTKEGMGLGLFISKKIIEAHKGSIKITSELNVGTQVEVTLPCLIQA